MARLARRHGHASAQEPLDRGYYFETGMADFVSFDEVEILTFSDGEL